MKICPILRTAVPDRCPRGDCSDCQADLDERSALIQFGGMRLNRGQADALAREQMRASLPGQRELTA